MRSHIIIFSIFVVTACAASLGHQDEAKLSESTTTITEASVHKVEEKHGILNPIGNPVSASESKSDHHHAVKTTNEAIGVTKLEEAIETVHQENISSSASDIGASTLEAFTKVLSSNELKEETPKTDVNGTSKIEVTTKTEDTKVAESVKENSKDVSAHTANHIHARETNHLVGAGSEIIQNGGYIGLNSGIGSGLLQSGGGVVRTENFENIGRLLPPPNVVYNQGISGIGGLVNTGNLVNSGGLLSSRQYVNSASLVGTGNQIYNSGGIIGTSGLGSGNIIQTNGILGTSNYQSGNIGIGGQIVGNTAVNNRRIALGLDELNSVPQTVEYSKQFYHFEAPEELQESGQITKQLSNVLKKNLQVIFINAPENTAATNAALQLAKQAIEQRTAIYVLSKEAEPAQLVGQLQQIQENIQNKPEVRIIKYRTPEDLERAKLEIQSQYEATGGSTETFNGGVVPVLNYASDAEAYREVGALLGPGIVSSTHLGSGNGHHAESSNVVSTVGSLPQITGGQNVAAGKQALLGSSIGQLNIIKSSNTGSTGLAGNGLLTSGSGLSSGSGFLSGSSASGSLQRTTISPPSLLGSGATQVGASSGSTKFFGTGPLISPSNSLGGNSISGLTTGYTQELGSNSIVGSISKVPVDSGVGLKTTGSSALGGTSTSLVDAYNVGVNDGFGSSSLQKSQSGLSSGSLVGSSSGISNHIVGGAQPGSLIGSSKVVGTGSLVGGGIGSGIQSGLQSGLNLGSSKIVSGTSFTSGGLSGSSVGSSNVIGSGSSNIVGSGSLLGSNIGSKTSSSSIGSGSTNIVGTATLLGTNSGSGSLLGSNTGNKIAITSFGTGSSNIAGSGSLLGSNSASKTSTSSSIGSGSSTIVGTGSFLGSSSGSKTSTLSLGTGSLNTIGSGSLLESGSGSKTSGSGSLLGTGSAKFIGSGSLQGSSSESSKTSISSFESGTPKTTGTGSSAGSYASHVTIESSKLSSSGPLTSAGSENLATKSGSSGSHSSELNGVTVLSSTHIDHDHGLSSSKDGGSKSVESESGYVSGLGIGTTIGEYVKKDNYFGSSSDNVLAVDVKKPSVNRQYLPPSLKKN